jgi:hypothetical protein
MYLGGDCQIPELWPISMQSERASKFSFQISLPVWTRDECILETDSHVRIPGSIRNGRQGGEAHSRLINERMVRFSSITTVIRVLSVVRRAIVYHCTARNHGAAYDQLLYQAEEE